MVVGRCVLAGDPTLRQGYHLDLLPLGQAPTRPSEALISIKALRQTGHAKSGSHVELRSFPRDMTAELVRWTTLRWPAPCVKDTSDPHTRGIGLITGELGPALQAAQGGLGRPLQETLL